MSNAASIDSMVASDMEVDSLEKYRSRPRQLARWLLESRDTLRAKYQGLKVELNRLKVRIRDLAKSRDNWRQRADAADQQVHAMKAEVERIAALLEQATDAGSQKKVNSHPVH